MPDLGRQLQMGLSQIGNSLMQIGLAKQKLSQQKEQFDLRKKKTEAELDLLEKQGFEIDEERELLKRQVKFMEVWYDRDNKKLDVTERKAKERRNQIDAFGKGAMVGSQQGDWREQGMFEGIEPDPTYMAEQATGWKWRRTDEPTSPEQYREDLRKAAQGKMSWDALKYKYGDKIQEIDQARFQFKVMKNNGDNNGDNQEREANLIEPRAEGLERIDRGAAYSEAIQSFVRTEDLSEEQAKAKTDQIIGQIQDLQRQGIRFEKISEYLREAGLNPELFLRYYR